MSVEIRQYGKPSATPIKVSKAWFDYAESNGLLKDGFYITDKDYYKLKDIMEDKSHKIKSVAKRLDPHEVFAIDDRGAAHIKLLAPNLFNYLKDNKRFEPIKTRRPAVFESRIKKASTQELNKSTSRKLPKIIYIKLTPAQRKKARPLKTFIFSHTQINNSEGTPFTHLSDQSKQKLMTALSAKSSVRLRLGDDEIVGTGL